MAIRPALTVELDVVGSYQYCEKSNEEWQVSYKLTAEYLYRFHFDLPFYILNGKCQK